MNIIDRDELIKNECNRCDGWCENCECDCLNCNSEHRCGFIDNVLEMPTIDPESLRPKGEWKKVFIGALAGIALECSNCEHKTGLPFNFCPNCGCDMRGEGK